MNRFNLYMFMLLGMSILLTQFTNCESYNSNNVFSTTPTPTPDTALDCANGNGTAACLGADSRYLLLAITTGDLTISSSVDRFDVSGTCFSDRYPSNKIEWHLKYSSGSEILSGNTDNITGKAITCESGRFRF